MTEQKTPFTIRDCEPDDVETVVGLVRELAAYEKLEEHAKGTPEAFLTHLFGLRPAAEAILAEVEGRAVGIAIFYTTFSTFRGRPGLYLEDLYVKPEHRGSGIGKRLLATIAQRARDRGCCRVEWAVLNWNEPSIGFYQSLNAKPMNEWTVYRLDDDALSNLAEAEANHGRTVGD